MRKNSDENLVDYLSDTKPVEPATTETAPWNNMVDQILADTPILPLLEKDIEKIEPLSEQ
jgi:hypothetical protein